MLYSPSRQQLIERLPVVVGKRNPARARQLAAQKRAVVDQGIVDDEVLRAEQVPDGRYVGGVAADEHHAVVDAVHVGQRALEFAVDGTLAGDQTAGRSRRTVAVDGCFGRRVDVGMTAETQVVVARKIGEGFAVDHRGGAGEAIVHAKEGIADAEFFGAFVENAQLLVVRVQIEAAPTIGNRVHPQRRAAASAQRGRRGVFLFDFAQPPLQRVLNQTFLERCRQSMQHLARAAHPLAARVRERASEPALISLTTLAACSALNSPACWVATRVT